MIYTVRGPIKRDSLGATLSHEHFKWEYDDSFAQGMYFDRRYDDEITQKAYDAIYPVICDLKKSGCQAIVETSPPIGGQNLKLLKKLSDETDMHIIPNTGWNVFKHTRDIFSAGFADQLAARWISDFENGLDTIDGIMIRPGYIKILLDRGNLSDVDRDMLRAAIQATKKTGMPIHCHILESKMLYKVLDYLESEDADMSKFLWAHADQEGDLEAIEAGISKGIWIGFDMIKDGTHEEKMVLIKALVDNGHKDRILLSQDYDFYEEYDSKGADHPCTTLFTKFLPFCHENGIHEKTMSEILTLNPSVFYNID